MKTKSLVSGDDCTESLAEDVANLNVSTSSITSASQGQLPGPSGWALVNPLFRGLSYLSRLYAHQGMFQETNYYAEQANKLVELVNSGAYMATALTTIGSTWLSAKTLDKAAELLIMAKELSMSSGESQSSIVLRCHLGRLNKLLENQEAELESYNDAHTILETLTNDKYISDLDHIKDSAAMLEEEMSRLTLKPLKQPVPRKAGAGKKAPAKRSASVSKSSAEIRPSLSDVCFQLASLRGLLLRQQAGAFMQRKRCDEAVSALKQAEDCSHTKNDSIDQHIAMAKQLLLHGIEQMAADPVYSVLQDSTISFPSVISSARNVGSTSERPSGTLASPPRKLQSNSSARNRQISKSQPPSGFFDKFRLAQEHLVEAYAAAVHVSPTAVVHSLSSLLNTASMLLSAAGPSIGKTAAHPSFAVCSMGKISKMISKCI